MMIMYNWLVIFIMFIIGNWIFVSKNKHWWIVWWSWEFIVWSIFFIWWWYWSWIEYDWYMWMVFLVFTVCEGARGWSIWVSMIRTHGNDYFQSFSWW
uniref:NADH-ubiquinone oxidoreductase chain 4L n=1 Tax=Samia ricini TaxID=63990 RepID=Q4FH06_SAMRI|nr:NADH dehydrogenase subunit 4L [Samia ricini]